MVLVRALRRKRTDGLCTWAKIYVRESAHTTVGLTCKLCRQAGREEWVPGLGPKAKASCGESLFLGDLGPLFLINVC